jgi:hypothetical protein
MTQTTATPFTKENLQKDGAYLYYVPPGCGVYSKESRFVGRFKYGRGGMGTFATFLRRNFTAEEYLARMDAGESPLEIAESKGYLLPHIKKELKRQGYPLTPAGFHQMITDQIAARDARQAAL